MIPVWPLLLAAIALAAAACMHGVLRAAERYERGGPGRSRDHVMLPVLLGLVLVAGFAADRLADTHPALLRDGGFALFLGLSLGQMLPRPPRRRR